MHFTHKNSVQKTLHIDHFTPAWGRVFLAVNSVRRGYVELALEGMNLKYSRTWDRPRVFYELDIEKFHEQIGSRATELQEAGL